MPARVDAHWRGRSFWNNKHICWSLLQGIAIALLNGVVSVAILHFHAMRSVKEFNVWALLTLADFSVGIGFIAASIHRLQSLQQDASTLQCFPQRKIAAENVEDYYRRNVLHVAVYDYRTEFRSHIQHTSRCKYDARYKVISRCAIFSKPYDACCNDAASTDL